jgi:hypothetical protein
MIATKLLASSREAFAAGDRAAKIRPLLKSEWALF